MSMIKNACIFSLMWIAVLPYTFQKETQDIRGVAVVTDVQGECWLYQVSQKKPSQVTRGRVLVPGDTLETGQNAQIIILLWDGDRKKSIFENTVYVVPPVSKPGNMKRSVLASTFLLGRQKYNALADFSVKSEEQDESFKDLSDLMKPVPPESISFILVYPRNESVAGANLEFRWTPSGSGQKYTFRLKLGGTVILSRETADNSLAVAYSFNPGERYSWEVEYTDSGKINRDSAEFRILPAADRKLLDAEFGALSEGGQYLTQRQLLLTRAFIYDRWNLHTQAIREYRQLLNQPNTELWEVLGFIKMSLNKMKVPDSRDHLSYFLNAPAGR